MLVLSLFPGIGLLDAAFEAEGFCVVRGPDPLWGGDVRRFHPPSGRFHGVIGGPPCQEFSRLAHLVRHNGADPRFGNLIPEFERVVNEAEPLWFLMENVPDAPVPEVPWFHVHSFVLNNRQLGEEQHRVRRWSFGSRTRRRVLEIDTVALEPIGHSYCGGDPKTPRRKNGKSGLPFNDNGKAGFDAACRAQGLPEGFDLPGFTRHAACRAVRQGVPLAMGRALARAVKEALEK